MHLLGGVIGFIFWIVVAIIVAIIVVGRLAREPSSPLDRVSESKTRRDARAKARGCLDWAALGFVVLIVWLIWRVWG
jgi:hypothetical protein